MNDDRYALIEISIGPLPEDCENWDDPRLERFSEQVAELVMNWDTPGRSDPGVSGLIRRVRNAGELGYVDPATAVSVEWSFTSIGHYVSTYCLHGHHGDCRQWCKFKDEHVEDDGRCRCHCHPVTL